MAATKYIMTSDKDANMALDLLEAMPPGNKPINHNGNIFWLEDDQAILLRSLGISFAKAKTRKWVNYDDNGGGGVD